MENKLTSQINRFFNDKKTISEGVHKYRLFSMRLIFFLTFILLGRNAWTELITHKGIWNPLEGVAYSFWAAYATLMILGLRRPLKMIPMLLLQFFYKLVWLIGVALPLWSNNHFAEAKDLAPTFIVGVVLDVFIIPWGYVYRKYF